MGMCIHNYENTKRNWVRLNVENIESLVPKCPFACFWQYIWGWNSSPQPRVHNGHVWIDPKQLSTSPSPQ